MAEMGRPTSYSPEILVKAREYLASCVDEVTEFHKTRGEKSDSYDRIIKVKLPTIEGLSLYLDIRRSTVYEWKEKHQDFSDIIDKLMAMQAERLLNNGSAGTYNSTIAKVILTKHGYREGTDVTTNGKDIPVPILNV